MAPAIKILISTSIIFLAFGPIIWGNFIHFENPLFEFFLVDKVPLKDIVLVINTFAWLLLLFFINRKVKNRKKIYKLANELGIDTNLKSLGEILSKIVKELCRKNAALSNSFLDKRIENKAELSRTLENIMSFAYRILYAESVELTLFDSETDTYHTSFVVGKPFSLDTQAILSDATEDEEAELPPYVMHKHINFAGSVLGSIIVAFNKNYIINKNDRDILSLIAFQSGVAIINASYTEELVKMRQFSDESVKVKTGFLANLSHEIRGPLGVMLNAVEIILDGLCGDVTPDQTDTLRMIKQNGEHLLDLINDVLDYAKVVSGKLIPQPVNLDLNDILKDIVSIMKTQAEKKSHSLIYKPCKSRVAVNIDKRHLRQIMINLLTNAVKYTPDGGKIDVWAELRSDQIVRINVKDNGIGIDDSLKEKVFAPFERIDEGYASKQIGAGLGMSLTKRLVEVNNGSIDFKSCPKVGTIFFVDFPIVPIENVDTSNEEEKNEVIINGNNKLILLMEGDYSEREITARFLKSCNFNVISVSTQTEAIEVLKSKDINLVILDNNLVDHSHDFFVKELRSSSNFTKLPIILVSSKTFSFDVEKYLKIGIDLCLSKPFQLKVLAKSCVQLIENF